MEVEGEKLNQDNQNIRDDQDNQGIEKCILCGDTAAALFAMPRGCVCSDKQIQLLCMQHVVRATPLEGMYLLEIIDENWEKELRKRFKFD
jgi:hypothetical protein